MNLQIWTWYAKLVKLALIRKESKSARIEATTSTPLDSALEFFACILSVVACSRTLLCATSARRLYHVVRKLAVERLLEVAGNCEAGTPVCPRRDCEAGIQPGRWSGYKERSVL
jgi:hypothetical protein